MDSLFIIFYQRLTGLVIQYMQAGLYCKIKALRYLKWIPDSSFLTSGMTRRGNFLAQAITGLPSSSRTREADSKSGEAN